MSLKDKIFKDKFLKNIMILLSGSVIAQAIPVIISPILTRIYSAKDFGILALFISFTLILGSISNGKYDMAIVLPKKERNAVNLVVLSIIVSFIISVFLFIIVIVFNKHILFLINNNDFKMWLYFIPLVVLFMGIYNALLNYNIRLKNFKSIASVNIYRSLITVITQISIGLVKPGAGGLISGQIMSNVVGNYKIGQVFLKKNKNLKEQIDFKRILVLLKKYINFPKYSAPANFLFTVSNNVLNILISASFSITYVGYYALVYKSLGMPLSLISNSISQVLFQKAVEEKNQKGNAIGSFNMVFKKLFLISFFIFAFIYFIIEDLFIVIFGKEWALAGEMAKILLPLFFIRSIVSPLSILLQVFEKQRFNLFWQIGLLLINVLVFVCATLQDFSIFTTLHYLTLILVAYYIFYVFIIRKVSKGS